MDPQHGLQQPDLIVGQTIGNYLVIQKLGEGGMGSVYLAEHPGIGKKVAIKVLHAEFSSNRNVTERFFTEAKAVNDIGHPNIVDVVDYGIIQAGPGREQLVYFIMEYLGGMTLSKLIRTEGPVPPERALMISLQVADALAASHKCGIVHRDLKPDNIMLIQRGRERDFVKLLDFGIAKLTSAAGGSQRTQTGVIMGTPAYMSPEQCDGRGQIDHRTDVYALGIVLYELLVGQVPFIGEGYGDVLVQHLTRPPVPPSQFRMLNPHVEAVVMKALEKRPDMRYPTMDEMLRAMADPVGFVESHGGLGGFAQRQLMPSTAPLPPIHYTPGPMTSPLTTPVPHHPSQIQYSHTPTPPPGMYTTPVPTTLGSAAGEVQPRRGKAGFVIAGVLVVAAAAVATVLIMQQAKSSDDPIAADPAKESGNVPPPADAAIAAVVVPDAAEVKPPAIDAGVAETVKKVATIVITTQPPGAKIYVNGVDMDTVTPNPIELPLSNKGVKITLKLDGYKDYVFDKVVPNQDANLEKTLKKRAAIVVPRGSGDNGGGGSNDTGLIRPGD